jgi:hypothetical protein
MVREKVRFEFMSVVRLHASLVNSDRWRHFPPYRNTKIGIGARARLNELNNVKAHPYPSLSANGPAANGRKVPMRHLDTITPVNAEAEYSPHASTTYAESGTMTMRRVVPMRPTESNRNATCSRNCAIQPKASTVSGRRRPPTIVSGRRYSGRPFFVGLLSRRRI